MRLLSKAANEASTVHNNFVDFAEKANLVTSKEPEKES